MKRRVAISLCVGLVAALIFAILVQSAHKTPVEIARLSESLVMSKVHAYYRAPSEATLAAAKAAITNHRKVIEGAGLSQADRETMERNLHEQTSIVRSIARNWNLEL